MPDWSEVSDAMGIDISKVPPYFPPSDLSFSFRNPKLIFLTFQFDALPLDPILFNNPVFRFDAPEASYFPNNLSEHDEEPYPKLDFFQISTQFLPSFFFFFQKLIIIVYIFLF